MEISTQQVTEDVASKLWEASDPLGFKGPLEVQDKMVQYHLKNMVLPVVTKTLPIAEKHFKDKIRDVIAKGQSLGLSADMILLDISVEVQE